MVSDDAMDDKKLIAALHSGSTQAFSVIYNRFSEPIYLHLRKKIDCREDARDLVQEIFASLWQKRTALPVDTCLSAYLFAAAKYRAINYLAHHRVGESVIQDLARRLQDAPASADYLVREHNLSAVIENAVADLPDKMQLIFRMSRQDLLTHKEIANHLNLSETTVKKQVANALKILRPKISNTISILITIIYHIF